MAYIRRLIHRAAVKRPTVATSETGVGKATLAPVTGMDAVKCLLMPATTERDQQKFGADLKCDAVVCFPRGTDIRPKIGSTDGKNDRLEITDERGVLSKWTVIGTNDPASARGLVVAYVVAGES